MLLLLITAPLHAAHLSYDETMLLQHWPQTQQFLDNWLDKKNRSGSELVKGLLDSHSEQTPDGRILIELDEQTQSIAQTNQMWLRHGIRAFLRKDWGDAKHSISQISQPATKAVQAEINLLASLLAFRDRDYAKAREYLQLIPQDSPLIGAAHYNNAVAQMLQQDLQQSSTTLKEQLLTSTASTPRSIRVRTELLLARALAVMGDEAGANQLLQRFQKDHPSHTYMLPVKADVHNLLGQSREAIAALLELTANASPSQLEKSQASLLETLYSGGAIHQVIETGSELIRPALRNLQRQRTLNRQRPLTTESFFKQLENRRSGQPPVPLQDQMSTDSALLLAELERTNTLLELLKSNIAYIGDYRALFDQGSYELTQQINRHKDLLPRNVQFLPPSVKKLSKDIQSLEQQLSELVGQPDPWEKRYKLLNGLAIWKTTKPFQNPWWDNPSPDISAARRELGGYLAERLASVNLLNEERVESKSQYLSELETQARQTLIRLGAHRKLLMDNLSQSLQNEPARNLLPQERELLWLAVHTLRDTQSLESEAPPPFYQLTVSGAASSLTVTHPSPKIPDLTPLFGALNELADNALNEEIRFAAIRHLADLKLGLAELKSIADSPDIQRIDASFEQAIALYQRIEMQVEHPDNWQVLYQLARALDLAGRIPESLARLERLENSQQGYPLRQEVLFRIGEVRFGMGDFDLSAKAYKTLTEQTRDADFLEKAHYKLGWSYYRIGQYVDALDQFFVLVDQYWPEREQGSERGKRLLEDTLRVIGMTFANMDGASTVRDYFAKLGDRPYSEQIYLDLAQYYQTKQRYNDTAITYAALLELFPNSEKAPYYQAQVVESYTAGGFPSRAWPAREHFVTLFGSGSPNWQNGDKAARDRIMQYLPDYLEALAQRDHALAQKSTLAADFQKAVNWYQNYIDIQPNAPRTAAIYLLKGDAHTDMGGHQLAANAYEQAAYQFPGFDQADEAGYAALLSYQQLYQTEPQAEKEHWLQRGIEQSLKFINQFPDSSKTVLVQTKLAEDRLIQDDNSAALELAQTLLQRQQTLQAPVQLRLWRVVGHASFAQARFVEAEKAYLQALTLIEPNHKEYPVFRTRLAESMYKQAEAAQERGDYEEAIAQFRRIGEQVPEVNIRPTADFDAATLLIKQNNWIAALAILENFHTAYPGHELQGSILEKLILGYENTQNWDKASYYLRQVFLREKGSELGRDALWRSAALQEKAGNPSGAVEGYKLFLSTYPTPLEPAMEAIDKLSQLGTDASNTAERNRWLNELITRQAQAGEQSTARTTFLASQASLVLGQEQYDLFGTIQLGLPLQKTLPSKQRAMENAIGFLSKTAEFGLAEHSTRATNLIGHLYRQLAKSLMTSDRPPELDDLQREQYDILLEEQALPFEDQAIELYELNVGRIKDDIYTPAIGDSLEQLRSMMPSRYNKPEKIPGYAESIE